MVSPLELALVADPQNPMAAQLLGSVKLDYTAEQLKAQLNTITTNNPAATVLVPMNAENKGVMALGPAASAFEYTAKNQLNFLVGLGVDSAKLDSALSGLTEPSPANFIKMEQSIDDNGQGLVVWFNSGELLPALGGFLPVADAPLLVLLQDGSLKSFAAGFGTSDTKGRFRIVAEIPDGSLIDRYLPNVNTQHKVATVGDPKLVMQLNWPLMGQVDELIEVLDNSDVDKDVSASDTDQSPPSAQEKYKTFQAEMHDAVGFDIDTLLTAYGPELTWFKDDLGYFLVAKIQNQNAHVKASNALTSMLSNAQKGELSLPLEDPAEQAKVTAFLRQVGLESREVNGTTINHLSLPSFYSLAELEEELSTGVPPAVIEFLFGGKTHVYWVAEGENIVFAKLPQDLIERAKFSKTSTVDRWLEQNKLKQHGSVFAISGKIPESPKKLYSGYLSVIQAASDALNADVDMFAFPPASKLGLPDSGVYSLQLDSADDFLALELTYEKSAAEILFGGGGALSSVAVVGVLAAVALPAYQDYTQRANIAGVFVAAASAQNELASFFQANGRLPTEEEAWSLALTIEHEHVLDVYFDASTGTIVLETGGGLGLNGHIYFTAETEGDSLEFICESDLQPKLLPASCR